MRWHGVFNIAGKRYLSNIFTQELVQQINLSVGFVYLRNENLDSSNQVNTRLSIHTLGDTGKYLRKTGSSSRNRFMIYSL